MSVNRLRQRSPFKGVVSTTPHARTHARTYKGRTRVDHLQLPARGRGRAGVWAA